MDFVKTLFDTTFKIYIDLSQWMGTSDIQIYLEIIKESLQKSRKLTFDYIGHHGSMSPRVVDPCQLVLKGSHWYLYGYCHKRNEYRLFRVSRMSNLEIQEETFLLRDYPKPQLEFADILITMQIEVKLLIHKSIMDRVLDYCTYKNFCQEDDENFIVSFPFVENDYHYDILLSFGDKCECLEPLHVRTNLKRRIGNIASLYES